MATIGAPVITTPIIKTKMRNLRAEIETAPNRLGASRCGNERQQDDAIFRASMFYGVAMLVLVLLQYLVFETYSALPFFCLFAFFVHLTWIRRSLSDPFSILILFAFIYSAFPLLFGRPRSLSSLTFGFDGAAIIYAVGSISLVFGIGIAIVLIPGQSASAKRAQQRFRGRVPPVAALGASVLSLALTAIYVARNGSVLGGGMSYADSFEVKQTAGAGIFFLAAPLSAAGACFLLTGKDRPSSLPACPRFGLLLTSFLCPRTTEIFHNSCRSVFCPLFKDS